TLTLSQREREQTDTCGERLGGLHLAPRYEPCLEGHSCLPYQRTQTSCVYLLNSAEVYTRISARGEHYDGRHHIPPPLHTGVRYVLDDNEDANTVHVSSTALTHDGGLAQLSP